MKRPVEQMRIDWIRILVPYEYEPVLDEVRDSAHHHELPVGKVVTGFEDIFKRLCEVLAIDGDGYTDAECFQYRKGGSPYDARYSRDGFDVRFNDLEIGSKAPVNRIVMGLKLDIQGMGCRYIEHALARDGHDWNWFFLALQSAFPDVTYRRIDIARDFFRFTRHLTPLSMATRFIKERKHAKATNEHGKFVITRRTVFRTFHEGDVYNGTVMGDTFYLGAPSDDLMLRVYDKDAERIYSHGDTWRQQGGRKQYWYRWEVQSSGDVADKIGHLLADGETGGSIWRSCVNRMFAIAPTPLERKRGHVEKVMSKLYDPQNGKYVEKEIEVADWWADWIDYSAVDDYHLTTIVRHADVEGSDRWLEGPVAHSLVVRLIAHILRGGDGKQLLEHWLTEGTKQLNFADISFIKSRMSLLNDLAVKQLTKGNDFSQQVSPDVTLTANQIADRLDHEKEIAVAKLTGAKEEHPLTLADYLDKEA